MTLPVVVTCLSSWMVDFRELSLDPWPQSNAINTIRWGRFWETSSICAEKSSSSGSSGRLRLLKPRLALISRTTSFSSDFHPFSDQYRFSLECNLIEAFISKFGLFRQCDIRFVFAPFHILLFRLYNGPDCRGPRPIVVCFSVTINCSFFHNHHWPSIFHVIINNKTSTSSPSPLRSGLACSCFHN